MPCKECSEGLYKWGETGECEYATLQDCEDANASYEEMKTTSIVELVIDEDSQELAIDAISLVSAPAIEQDFVFFGKEKNNLTFAKIDEEKRMLVSPALIPNKQIFRHNPNTQEDYYVYFSPETVRQASELYLKNNNHHKATEEHNERVSGVLTVESWIKEGDSDKSKLYGYDLPNGTWFVKMKIENDELWQKIKAGELKGLSIEGYFTNKFEQMQKKEFTNEEIKTALKELLSSDKVELAVVDDIKKLYSDYIAQNEKYDKIYAPIFKVEGDVQNWIKGMEKIKSKSETLFKDTDKMMKELGVKNIPYLDDLSKIINDKIVLAHAKAQLAVLKKF
jgi:hypothetical protein